MQYGILLWPHANSRYQQAVSPLALGELNLMLKRAGLAPNARMAEIAGAGFMAFHSDEALTERAVQLLSRHSMMYLLCGIDGENRLLPITSRNDAYLDYDLSGILKYKGKTNEAFTRFMMNVALMSSAFFDQFDDALCVYDPMCGRLTTLFEAVNRGYDAYGSDTDARELTEGLRFFRKYLEYHHIKHGLSEKSLTLPGKRHAPSRSIAFANDPQAFKAGDRRILSVTELDAGFSAQVAGAERFHIVLFDMPYGVQHGPGKRESFDELLARALPAIRRSLKRGGSVALSFNTYTLPADKVRALLADSGFDVPDDALLTGFAHWVEQAIVRDVAIGVKPQ